MVWVEFLVSAALVVLAANKLAQYGDVIAVRTRLGGMFIGTLLLAGATSLPELLSALNALSIGAPNLAAGSMFGSNMFNMFMLGILDLLNQNARILRQVAMNHALTASLAGLIIAMVVFFMMADIDVRIGWVGVDSLLIIGAYIVGVQLLQQHGGQSTSELAVEDTSIPSLRYALIGFSLAAGSLLIITPWMVASANEIAAITGLSTGFVGATLVAITTSLPELVATIAATRIKAYDLAIGNLFGSNLFNMFALGLVDVLYFENRFLSIIDPTFAVIGMLGLILTILGLIGNIARFGRRLIIVEIDALVILILYLWGMWFLYSRGIGV